MSSPSLTTRVFFKADCLTFSEVEVIYFASEDISPIFSQFNPSLSEVKYSSIGLGDPPRTTFATSPNLFSSHAPLKPANRSSGVLLPSHGKSRCNSPFLWALRASKRSWAAVISASKEERQSAIFCCSFDEGKGTLIDFIISPDKFPCPPCRYFCIISSLLCCKKFCIKTLLFSDCKHKTAWLIAPLILAMALSPLFAPYKATSKSPLFTNFADDFSSPSCVRNNSVSSLLISAERINGIVPP